MLSFVAASRTGPHPMYPSSHSSRPAWPIMAALATLAKAIAFAEPTPSPRLEITSASDHVLLQWMHDPRHPFYLQVATNLTPTVSWTIATDLSASLAGSELVLQWTRTEDLEIIQSATNLDSGAVWIDLTNAPILTPTAASVHLPLAGPARFFRLRSWDILFDGSSVAQFRGYRQTTFPYASWEITGAGELRPIAGAPSVNIITTNQYDDFELRWEWKASPKGNSGVNYRATEAEDNSEWTSPEYQLLDDASYNVGPIAQFAAVWALLPPGAKSVNPANQWNKCGLIVAGHHVEHWLNGKRVLSYELDGAAFLGAVRSSATFNKYPKFGKATKGYIAFRHDGTDCYFRNIRLRALP